MAKVEYHDNRGTDEYAYGYVYFSDGSRVPYVGGTRQDTWLGHVQWTRKHGEEEGRLAKAGKYLRKQGVFNGPAIGEGS